MIYLDNAATTYPKPRGVADAVINSMNTFGGNPGRGSHKMSVEASREVFDCREAVAALFGGRPENTVFTYNATYALNIAIKSSYIYGSHILISDIEHNSVLRPTAAVTRDAFSSYSVFDSALELEEAKRPDAVISSIRSKMKPLTRTVVCCARSNITGVKMPVAEIGKFCRKNGLFYIVDASQSAGFDDIDIERDCIDVLCAPGHKGLYGPEGTGFLMYSAHGASCRRISPFIEGGSGYNSLDVTMPDTLPERLEGGTLNTFGLSGLKAGVKFIAQAGLARLREHEYSLIRAAYELLKSADGVSVYGYCNSPMLLFNIEGVSPEQAAYELDRRSICVRSGYHCSPLAHKRIGTPVGGAVRMSVGFFNTYDDMEKFAKAVKSIKI